MGTSTSSKGGGSRSPFDPEWLSPPKAAMAETALRLVMAKAILRLMPTLTGRGTRLAVKKVM